MLDDLIKLLVNMPDLTLSTAALNEFLERGRHLSDKLNLATFTAYLIDKPDTCISNDELNQILTYLKSWPALISELHCFLEILQIAWYVEHQSPASGDDILELFHLLMPKDEPLLTILMKKLCFAADVDKNNLTGYYFTVLSMAAYTILNGGMDNGEDRAEARKPDPYTIFLNKIQNPAYYNLLKTLVKLSALSQDLMQASEDFIFTSLRQKNINDYFIDDFISPEEKHLVCCAHIRKMAAVIQKEPFASDSTLTERVQHHIVYQDIELALGHTMIFDILKRSELMDKFKIQKEFSLDEWADVEIKISDRLRCFIGIPAIRLREIISLFWAPPIKIPLNTFIKHLSNKMASLHNEFEQTSNPECTTVGVFVA